MSTAQDQLLNERFIPALQAIGSALGFSIAITNLDNYIFYMRSKQIDLKISPGDPIPQNTAIRHTLAKGTVETLRGNPETFGVAYLVKTFPLRDQRGTIIGGCAVLETTETEDKLQKLSEDLSTAMDELAASSDEIMTQVNEMRERSDRLLTDMAGTQETIARSSSIVDFVHNVSRQSDILSLNAVVEAARLGGSNNTFNVVAKEMRSLAQETKASVEKVNDILQSIRVDSEETAEELKKFHSLVSFISEEMNGVFTTLHQVNEAASALRIMSSALMR